MSDEGRVVVSGEDVLSEFFVHGDVERVLERDKTVFKNREVRVVPVKSFLDRFVAFR